MISPTISEIYNELGFADKETDYYWDGTTGFVKVVIHRAGDDFAANYIFNIRVSTKAVTLTGKLLTSFEKTPFNFCHYISVNQLVKDVVRMIKRVSRTLIISRKCPTSKA